jgi:peptidoglycan/LPS O-acetylase OafA/YrhL
MSTSVSTQATTYIPGLDGIRAIAFVLVYLGHMGLERFIGRGGIGVTIFFFLSGYLITTLLRIESDGSGTISISQFYLRRTFRIFPPMYVTVAIWMALATAGVFVGTVYWQSIVVASLYLTNYANFLTPHGVPGGLGILWSLAVEEHFYLLFPWLFLLFLRRKWPRAKLAGILAGLCALALVWRCVALLWLHSTTNYYRTDTRFDSILFGCLLAVSLNPFVDEVPEWVRRNGGKLALVGLAGIIVSLLIRGPIFADTLRYTIQGLALAPIFVYVLSFPKSSVVQGLEYPWMRWVGRRSYAMYLIHVCIIHAFSERLGISLVLSGAVSAPLVLGYGWAMARFVEQPLAKLKKELASSPRKALRPSLGTHAVSEEY